LDLLKSQIGRTLLDGIADKFDTFDISLSLDDCGLFNLGCSLDFVFHSFSFLLGYLFFLDGFFELFGKGGVVDSHFFNENVELMDSFSKSQFYINGQFLSLG
jgi:hypothetical protein